MKALQILSLLAVAILAFSACGQPQPDSTIAAPTSLPSPTAQTVEPTTVPSPTPRPTGWVTLEVARFPASRTQHAMTLLSNGGILMFGGSDESGAALNDTWIFWPDASPLSAAPADSVQLGLNALGGLSTALRPSSLMSLPPAPKRADWTPVNPTDSPSARQGHSMVTLPDGRVLLFGGTDDQGAWFNDLHAFATDQWSLINPINDPPSARANHQAWVHGNRLYVLGGLADQGLVEDLWAYDLLNNSWQSLPNPPDLISLHAYPILINDKVYLLDAHAARYVGDMLLFNMTNEQWEREEITGSWPSGERGGYMTVQAGNKAYMQGGGLWDPNAQDINPITEFWEFDLTTFAWTQLEDMPFPIVHGGEAVLEPILNRIIAWGGEQENDILVPGDQTLIYYLEQ